MVIEIWQKELFLVSLKMLELIRKMFENYIK